MRAGLIPALLALVVANATAHPLGNNTVNRQAAIAVAPGEVRIDYRMDLAEIPTLAAEAAADTNGDGNTSPAEWRAQARRWALEAAAAQHLDVDGRGLSLRVADADVHLREGEAGLKIALLHARLRAPLPPNAQHLAYRDDFRPREQGWKEIWLRGQDGVSLAGSFARADRSRALTAYPPGVPPPDELRAEAGLRLPVAASVPDRLPAATRAPDTPAPAPADAGPALPADAATPPVAAIDTPAPKVQPASHAPAASPGAFFRLGIHHILVGFDHLAFLAGLLLLAPRFGQALRVVTAFTLAHSLTLYLAATGHVVVAPTVVEPAIALTVAWVGGTALRGRGGQHGPLLAFAFGLVHGLGFAGALAETLGEGRPSLGPLLAFNLGIEACQVALVAGVLAVTTLVRRGHLARFAPPIHGAASIAVLGSGLAWFALRL